MDRIVAVAACDFRRRGARGARTLPVVDADFRAGIARADSERRVPCVAYRKYEAGLDFVVAPRDPACFGNRVCLYSAARARHSRGAARGECAVAGDGAGAGRGSPGRDADPRAIPARARDRLPDDGKTGIARDRAVYPARRDRDWAIVRRFVVDVAAESLLNRDSTGSTADERPAPCPRSGEVEEQDFGLVDTAQFERLLTGDGGAVAGFELLAIERDRAAGHLNIGVPGGPEFVLHDFARCQDGGIQFVVLADFHGAVAAVGRGNQE